MTKKTKKKKKFYVVWKGRKAGIFKTWEECKTQVEDYSEAQYKSFYTLTEAELAFKGSYFDYINVKPKESKPLTEDQLRKIGKPIKQSYCVDASCIGNPGPLEYRCVHTTTGKKLFNVGPLQDGNNNVGEFLAIVHALALFKKRKISTPIYSDSIVAIAWIENRKCRSELSQTENNAELFQLIERAEKWLLENDYENRVLKWWTEVWGEIPADFGRK